MGSLSPQPSRLFSPLTFGTLTLQHRLAMAPLTRFRASDSCVPLPIAATYYSQRASVPGTLLITEATYISARAGGLPNVPGIYSAEQIAAWRVVTDAVHAKGSYIFLQIWGVGRAADANNLASAPGGPYNVVSASAIPLDNDHATPRALSVDEIQGLVADFAQAARNAIEAGFDGVEIHGANGLLIDQFTQDITNARTDTYGGSVANRSRFGLEVARAVVDAVGAERVGFRVSPWSTYNGMKMNDPVPQFSHLLRGLQELKLAYMHIVESRVAGNEDVHGSESIAPFVRLWGSTSPVLIAGGYEPETAKKAVDEEYKDQDVVVVFGRYFISSPDLPFRIANSIDLASYDRDTFYKAQSPDGYIDYPFSTEFENAKR